MDYPVTGLRHITVCADGAQEDVDFFTQVVGQPRSNRPFCLTAATLTTHLYYANGKAEPGTVMTTFPYHKGKGTPRFGSDSGHCLHGRPRNASILAGSPEPAQGSPITRSTSGSGSRSSTSSIPQVWRSRSSRIRTTPARDGRRMRSTSPTPCAVSMGRCYRYGKWKRKSAFSWRRRDSAKPAWTARIIVSRSARAERARHWSCCTSPIARRAVGDSAPAPRTMWRSMLPTMRRSRSSRPFSKKSAIPIAPRSRTGTIFTPSTRAVPATSWWNAPRLPRAVRA